VGGFNEQDAQLVLHTDSRLFDWPLDGLFDLGKSMSKEALKMALEVMRNQGDVSVDEWIATEKAIKEAIACLRLVIDAENISSKPMAWEQFYPEMGKPKLAYLSPTESPENACYIPPQRTWVGLTDEEMQSIAFESADALSAVFVAEAKLRSKNS